jgi:sugar lactone lactonase YvrE
MPISRLGSMVPPMRAADGWQVAYCVPPGRFMGSNGMQFGPDGRLHVAEMMGSRISALDTATGEIAVVSPVNGAIHQPDDLAFDSHGSIFATEIMEGRVGALMADGTSRVLACDMPSVNGVTVSRDRIFVDEFRAGGRMWEVFRDGSAPRLIADDLQWPNALSLGPDGYLYSPSVMADSVIRVPVEGGPAETFITGVVRPSAVKFDDGGNLYAVSSLTGEITAIDLQSRALTCIGATRCGADNFAIDKDGRIFVSHFVDGGVYEIVRGGAAREIVSPGFIGPFGLTVAADGAVYVADSVSLARLGPGEVIERVSQYITDAFFPGILRNVAAAANGGFITANSAGTVAAYTPDAALTILGAGLGQIMGVAALGSDGAAACDYDGGRLLELTASGAKTVAQGLGRPTGLAIDADGSYFVADARAGRVVHVQGSEAHALLSGLVEPHGLALCGRALFVLDRGAGALHRLDLDTLRDEIVAQNLPVGRAAGIAPHDLPGIAGLMPGPILPFAGIACGKDGSVYVSADSDGSVVRVRFGRLG